MLTRLNLLSRDSARSKPARFGEDPTRMPAMVIAAAIGLVLLGGIVLIVHGML